MTLSNKKNKCLLYTMEYIKNNYNKLPIMEIKTENTKFNKFSKYEIINSLRYLKSQNLVDVHFEYSDDEIDTFVIYNITEKGITYLNKQKFWVKVSKFIITFIKILVIPLIISIVSRYILNLLKLK